MSLVMTMPEARGAESAFRAQGVFDVVPDFGFGQGGVGGTQAASYSVHWCGERVQVPGPNGRVSSFRFVLALPDAPCPALLVAHRGFQLLTQEDDRLVVRPLARPVGPSGNASTLQWLDACNGQPSCLLEVSGGDTGLELSSDFDARLLLLNGETVFDTASLQSWALQPASVVLGGAGPRPEALREPARFLSPLRQQIVFFSRYRLGRDTSALRVFEFARRRAYLVLYDDPWVRLDCSSHRSAEWFNQHFQWSLDTEGRERLVWRRTALPTVPRHWPRASSR